MLTHALKTAFRSNLFDHIHVSTEDDEIAAVAGEAGAPPIFKRDTALADDHTPIREVVRTEVARFAALGMVFDTVLLLYATAVLIEADDLRRAYAVFAGDPGIPLLAVVNVGAPLDRLMVNQAGILQPVQPGQFSKRTQGLKVGYRDAGAFCFFTAETFNPGTDTKHFLEFKPFVLPKWKGVDIDTPDDWHFAELVKAGLNTESL
jgi:N-acylneuraminate cytidylyltransferase